MIHRTDVVALPVDATRATRSCATIRESGLSRIPVYEENASTTSSASSRTREYLL